LLKWRNIIICILSYNKILKKQSTIFAELLTFANLETQVNSKESLTILRITAGLHFEIGNPVNTTNTLSDN